jgi:hypothetical protein
VTGGGAGYDERWTATAAAGKEQHMTTTPDEPLNDNEMETTNPGHGPADATDADGADGQDAGGDGDSTDSTDGDSTDGTDADGTDA